MRLFQSLLFLWLVVGFLRGKVVEAHQVLSVGMEFEEVGEEWHLGGVMDIAYMLPETRGDIDAGPLSRWAVMNEQGDVEHARYRRETERFLRDSLRLTFAGKELSYEVRFTDFDQQPLTLPEDDEDVALLTTVLVVPVQKDEGKLVVHWNDDLGTELILGMKRDNRWRIFGVPKGDEFVLWEVGSSGVSTSPLEGWLEWRSWLWSGYRHVLPKGWDHVAFMVGMFLLVPTFRGALKLSLLFTLAHSATLICLVLGWVTFSGPIVEALIGLSIVWIGVEVWREKSGTKWRWRLILLFGLLHGLGFGAMLLDAVQGHAGSELVVPLAGYNIGVEIAQISLLIGCFVLLRFFRKWRHEVSLVAGLLIAIYGSVLVINRVAGLVL